MSKTCQSVSFKLLTNNTFQVYYYYCAFVEYIYIYINTMMAVALDGRNFRLIF